jgi:hypothetical protein
VNDAAIDPRPATAAVVRAGRTRARWPRRRDVVALLLSATLITCTDNSTGPAGGGRGSLAIRPTFSSPVNIASFGLTIDSLRVRVTRPVDLTVFARTFFFDPNDDTLQLSLPVQLIAAVESLAVHLEFLAGTRVLFAGSDTVVVAVGVPDTTATADVALTYVGPGAGVTSIRITPTRRATGSERPRQRLRARGDAQRRARFDPRDVCAGSGSRGGRRRDGPDRYGRDATAGSATGVGDRERPPGRPGRGGAIPDGERRREREGLGRRDR